MARALGMGRGETKMRSRIGVLTFPMSNAGTIPLSHLIAILKGAGARVTLIAGDEGYSYFRNDESVDLIAIYHDPPTNRFVRVFNYVFTQIQASVRMLSRAKDIGTWIFFTGGDVLILPMIAAKLSRRKVIIAFPASTASILECSNDSFSHIMKAVSQVDCMLADRLVVYSPRLVREYGLSDYARKISFAREHYLDFDRFKKVKPTGERRRTIGYVGRLSEEKGAKNLIEVIRKLRHQDLRFLIIGEGALEQEFRALAGEDGLAGKIELLGWVPNKELPSHLNDMQLLVLPSYTEGLPNVLLEAMACGTPVLATPVGSVPDILEDGVNGFLLRSNSPEGIADSVLLALDRDDLEAVSEEASRRVRGSFNFESAMKGWARVLDQIH